VLKNGLIPLALLLAIAAHASEPIIDIHLHAYDTSFVKNYGDKKRVGWCTSPEQMVAWDPHEPYSKRWEEHTSNPACADPVWMPGTDEEILDETVRILDKFNIYGVASGAPETVSRFVDRADGRLLPALRFALDLDGQEFSVAEVEELHSQGLVTVFGEIRNHYSGVSPTDPRMEPYWALAEKLDIPVGIHFGPGPQGSPYLGHKKYRAHMHSVMALEDVLVKHPNLRVQVMHASYPMLDDILALLYVYPNVYVDTAAIVWVLPRAEFYRYLKTIVEAGYGNRVMFGSDNMVWPGVIERSVEVIRDAPFLSEQQKRDIFYNNAARFLRLSDQEIELHHSGD
tara:strand:+ start:1107 stop:2129 length:1023 start_codon:yes stop_codon:yes gene_type:complete